MKTNYVKILNRMNKIIHRVNTRRQTDIRSGNKGLKVKWRRTWKMLRSNYFVMSALVLSAALASCDGHHDIIDTSMKVGHVLCTDGRVMPLEECDRQGKEPIAVVFHLGNDEKTEGKGYAVYLHDLQDEAFADSVGVAQGTSATCTRMTATPTPTGCMPTAAAARRRPMPYLRCGVTDRVPIFPRWRRCACCM